MPDGSPLGVCPAFRTAGDPVAGPTDCWSCMEASDEKHKSLDAAPDEATAGLAPYAVRRLNCMSGSEKMVFLKIKSGVRD